MKNTFEKIKAFITTHKKAVIAVAAVIVIAAGSVFVSKVVIPKQTAYNNAVYWYKHEDYEGAISAFSLADGWLDSRKRMESVQKEYPEYSPLLRDDIPLKYGKYEQDNNTKNGPEDIEWIVYEKDGSKLLLVSKYALDVIPFNETLEDVTWETCTLRKWLNEDFLNSAFSPEEIDKIMVTEVIADSSPVYGTSGGNNTEDKVFIFNYTMNLNSPPFIFSPTEYVLSKNPYYNDLAGCKAWLTTPCKTLSKNTFLYGGIGNTSDASETYGADVNDPTICVRPAIWVDFSK